MESRIRVVGLVVCSRFGPGALADRPWLPLVAGDIYAPPSITPDRRAPFPPMHREFSSLL